MKKRIIEIIWIFNLLLLLLNIFLLFGIDWLNKNFGLVSMEEVVFHLNVPLEGTSKNLISSFIYLCVIPSVVVFILFLILFNFRYKSTLTFDIRIFKCNRRYTLKSLLKRIIVVLNIVLIISQLMSLDKKFKVSEYIKNQLTESSFIEKEYVDAKQANIKFKEKRNLIFIYLESIESTFADTTIDGQKVNLIPELEKIALDNTHFSNSDKLGGAYQVNGVGWTIGGMVGQSSGIPLKIPIDGNKYSGYDSFLPGVYSLGDILNKNGYNQTLIVGSNAAFGGRKDYFSQHGNYEIKDLFTARKEGVIPKNYYEFWGFEDSHLFEYAKKELNELTKSKKPFNLTLLTVNTHASEGYIEKNCAEKYNNHYANSISCSSKQVSEFIDWVKKQDFYKNTTIVIVGDHLTMANNEIAKQNTRTVYNAIINSYIDDKFIKREFSTLDMFPTTLTSMGATIEGDKLGLGVNLYSKKKTLIEEYGLDYVNNEISKKSNFYNKNLLYAKKEY